jgi:hypothetical protein
MLQRLFRHMRQNVVAWLALFVALGGTSAYAANEWTGENIVDGSLTGQDIFNNTVSGADITNGSLTGADVFDNTIGSADITNNSLGNGDFLTGSVDSRVVTNDSLTSADINNFSLGNGDFLTGSVNSRVVTDNELTGTDINESTLNMPPTTTATFAGNPSPVTLNFDDSFTKVASKVLPAGSWAIAATANTTASPGTAAAGNADLSCQLRNGNGFIGGATDRRFIAAGQPGKRSLSMNGGAQVPAGGGEVSLWCASQSIEEVDSSQMMIIRLDGFS